MHELGIVLHFIDMVEKIAEENHVNDVLRVTLELGEVSTIVPSYFKDCYQWAIRETKYMRHCELDLVIIQGISYCRTCRQSFPTKAHGRTCPHCGSGDTYLVTGRDVTIKDIQVV